MYENRHVHKCESVPTYIPIRNSQQYKCWTIGVASRYYYTDAIISYTIIRHTIF